jgi:hypothetical protein
VAVDSEGPLLFPEFTDYREDSLAYWVFVQGEFLCSGESGLVVGSDVAAPAELSGGGIVETADLLDEGVVEGDGGGEPLREVHAQRVRQLPTRFVISFAEANHNGPQAATQCAEDRGADLVALDGAVLVLVEKLEEL